MKRRYLVAGGVVALLGAAGAILLVARSEHAENKFVISSLALAASLSFVFTGLAALWRRPANRTGMLLAGTGYLWLLGALTTANDRWVFTLGFLVSNVAFAGFAHLILAFPSGRLESTLQRTLVVLTWAVLVVPAVALALVGGTDEVCGAACPDSTLTVWENDSTARAIVALSGIAGVAIIGFVLATLARRWRHASPPLRRTLTPVYAASALTLVLLVVALTIDEVFGVSARPVEYMAIAALTCVPIAFLAGVLRSRLARSGVGDLLHDLARGTPIREALARALSDPTLEVAYWQSEEGRYVSVEGKPLPDNGDPRRVSLVEHAGRPTAALLHDPTLAEERELIDAVSAAAALWLDNERLQSKLRAQYEFLETVVDAAPSLLCRLDREGRIINLNGAARGASGYEDEEDVRWRPIWEVFVGPHEREQARKRFEEAAPAHETASFEHTFVNRAGEELTIAWSWAPIYDESGHVTTIICGGLDITERRRRELELEVERDFAGTVANTIPIFLVGVWDDASINGYGPNPAFEHNLGWTREDTVGRNLLDFVHPDDRYLAGMAIASAANGVPSERRESRWLHKDGSERIVAWSAREILGLEGRTVVLVSGADVTERRRQEEEIRASRARIMQAGDDARRRLERNLHDGAQQRLVALSLSLRLAQSKVTTDPAAAERLLEASREELAAALEELRELARGIHPAVLTERGLGAAVEALASRSPVPVEIETPAKRLPAPVEAAAYYVVAEALANVAKYARATSAAVSVAHENEHVRVEVSDDGVGGADPAVGSGLSGLADRVAALEGSLDVSSPRGGGTRITAEIPLPPEASG
jgi:PAS domain S-box-containing protein